MSRMMIHETVKPSKKNSRCEIRRDEVRFIRLRLIGFVQQYYVRCMKR